MLKNWVRDWLLPPGILNFIKKLKRSMRYWLNRNKTTADIVKFKDIHKGKRCFILATGPSINQMDLTVLKNEISIAVSFFGYHKDIKKICPKYHVCAPNHEPLGEKNALNYFNMIKECYPSDIPCFFGITQYKHSFDNVLLRYPDLKPEQTYFIDYSNSEMINENNKCDSVIWDPCKTPFALMTVAFEAIMIAAYMGCNEIYLLGCDYNYIKDIEGRKEQHFYPDSKTVQGREYIAENGLEPFFKNSYLLWKRYRLIFEALEQRGITVYNASPDSLLDMFPKVSISSLNYTKDNVLSK